MQETDHKAMEAFNSAAFQLEENLCEFPWFSHVEADSTNRKLVIHIWKDAPNWTFRDRFGGYPVDVNRMDKEAPNA